MNIEESVGLICKINLSNKQETTGIVLAVTTKDVSMYGHKITFLDLDGKIEIIREDDLEKICKTEVDKDVTCILITYLVNFQLIQRKESKIKKLKNDISQIIHEQFDLANSLLNAQGIMTEEVFLSVLAAKLGVDNDSPWVVSTTPGSCVSYCRNEKRIYFYKEMIVVEHYAGDRSSLTTMEYDRNLCMRDKYEDMPEFKEYVQKYSRKLFENLPIENICFVGDKYSLRFKSYQYVDYSGKLTLSTMDEIIRKINGGEKNA